MGLKVSPIKKLFSKLVMDQFEDESKKDNHKPENLEIIKKCIEKCSVVDIEKVKYYRARKIIKNDADISFKNGVPLSGYPAGKSGVAPVDKIKEGRLNEAGEQVLYISNDIQTAVSEIKISSSEYASVASCEFVAGVKLFDFTPYTKTELEKYVQGNGRLSEKDEDDISYMELFVRIQLLLTSKEYSEENYKITRDFSKILKEFKDISGIKYKSSFTDGHNIAIWDNNKFVRFSNGWIEN